MGLDDLPLFQEDAESEVELALPTRPCTRVGFRAAWLQEELCQCLIPGLKFTVDESS